MSFSVTEAFVQEFSDNVMLLSQQRGSVLSGAVRVKNGVVGKRTSFERIAATSMQLRTSRHGDTPLIEQTHSRRWANIADYDWADLIDSEDELKMLISLESPYALNAAWAAGRTRDDILITAMLGTAVTGEEAGGTQTLPSAQQIAHASVGLTLTKIRSAAKILNQGEILPEMRFFVHNAESLDDLLGDTTITNADFNSVRLLMMAEINAFMGFIWLRTERLTNDSDSNRQNIAFQRLAVGLAVARNPMPRISERGDKNYATQVYMTQSLGAVRVEDAGVVEVAVVE
jgi:hypothetical protein